MWQLFKSRFGAEKCELSDFFIFNLAGILTTENLKKTDILKHLLGLTQTFRSGIIISDVKNNLDQPPGV